MILYSDTNTVSINTVLFDFDGVIADTESVFSRFDCRLLNEVLEQAGYPATLTADYIRTLAGNGGEEKLEIIASKNDFAPAPYMENFIRKRTDQRKTLFLDEPPTYSDGLFEFIESYTGRYALATNKKLPKITRDLDNIPRLAALFDGLVFCLEEGLNKKPAPDILLHAAIRVAFHPPHTAYIGDNVIDIDAAKNAGMIPIGFIIEKEGNHERRVEALAEAGAALVINSLNDISSLMTE